MIIKTLVTLNQNELSQFRSKNIGIVFQQFYLLKHLTALENVSIPLELQKEKNADELARNALNLVKLSHRLAHFHLNYQWGKPTGCYHRAMVTQPRIVLADEPSGNLDQKTATKSWN